MKTKFLQRVVWLMIPLLTIFTTNVWGASGSKVAFGGTSGTAADKCWSFTSAKNSAQNAPAYSSSQLRLYYASNGSGCSATITAASGYKLTKIVIYTSSTSYRPTVKFYDSASPSGTSTTPSWGSGTTLTYTPASSQSNITFQNANTSNTQLRTTYIEVYYEVSGGTTYSVTYNKNNASASGTMTDSNSPYASGATVTVLANGFTAPSGKVFSHWDTKADDSGTDYAPGATFSISGNTTLYAQWATAYTVTYNLNGGTGTTPTESAKASGATFTLHDGTTGITPPTKKVFSKWRDQDGTDYEGGDTYTMPSKNVTLTAQWVTGGGDYVLVEDVGDIGPGKYLIVYNNTNALNTHYGNVNANTYATYTNISSYYSNKKIASNATTDALAYTVAETTNGYSISHKESGTTYYLGNSNNSTGAYLRWDNPFTTSQDEWTLGVNSIVSARNSNYAIRWNTSSPRFAIYNLTGQSAIQLFKQEEACDDPELAYATGSVTKTYGASTFTNTLTNSHGVAVTYSSSDPTVATVNGSGQVTILKAGSTTITASSIAQTVSTVDYCADEASYTLTVNKANISPTLTYTPSSVAVGENTSAPTVGGNTGGGGVTYAITSATPSGCATINTSTGVVTGVAVGSVTVTATVAATTNYNGGTATATVTINAAANFTNGATVFVVGKSSSGGAWVDNACVKACFHAAGVYDPKQETYWIYDITEGGKNGNKMFAVVVPASGDFPYLDLYRFNPDCSSLWNSNGGASKAESGSSNIIQTVGGGNNDVSWYTPALELHLMGDPNSWASSLATFSDQGAGVWEATYNNYAPANAAGESQAFKINDNYGGWFATDNGQNVTLDGMHVGSTYNITASYNIPSHTLTMSKTFVKGTVHFDLQGHGSAISDLTNVAAGSKISAPTTPSATGYDFGGWYKEPACTNAWNFGSDVVNETMTLYAKWTKHNYTITSTLNHCSSSPAIPSSYEYTGSAASLSYTISADAGYRLPTTITVTGTTHTWNPSSGALVLTGTITNNVTITISAVQTHTVTWLSNGSNYVSPVTYDHGATLAFPAGEPTAPSSCSEKVFVGWTSDSEITSETSTEPTLITEGGAVNANATYRAVFADEEGGGTKWVLTAITAVTAGTYAILNQENQPFNGTVNASGHGDCVSTAFSFTNGEATSAPTGTCEIEFQAVTGGFKLYNAATDKYLYATKAGSGGLSWHATESSYWYYASTNWTYKSNSAYLRSYNSATGGIRTYGNNSGNGVIKLAKKTGGVSYDNYITTCCSLKPVTGLAVSSSTANSVTLTWTAPSPTTGIDHLELRNASTDAKIGSNIAVGTTTTSVSGLVECNTYSYKIVSVGASCETSSEVVEAQPFSGAKTVTFNYNGGSGSPASFTTSCAGNTVALPTPDTRAGYTFQGWWSASSGGVKKGDAGDIYTVSGTTTLWAHWSETNYTVTMAQDPAAGATLTGGTTTAHYGGTINISTTVPSGYRFTGWTASPSVTFADASATSTSFTMPNSDVTVTAHFVQVHTLTFDVPTGGGSAVTPPATADHGGTVTLPNVTGIAAEYSCETFLGWTTTAPNAEGGTKWSSTPTIKAAGATSDVINSNTTFYAVYSRSGGGASGTVELTQSDITAWYTAANAAGTTAYTTQNTYTAGGYTWTAKCQQSQYSSIGRLNLRVRTNTNGVSWIQIPTLPGNITTIVCDISKGNNNYSSLSGYNITFQSGTTSGESVIATSNTNDVTTRTIDLSGESYNTGYLTATYDGTINIHSITVNYGPAPVISHNVACPDCEISQFTLSYNANTSYFPGSTTTCTGVTDYRWEDHDNEYTICSTEPTLEGHKFTHWATNANGSGTTYDAGEVITCVGETPITLYAQYERVYTVTFNNQGVTTPVTQASEGATIAVPSATSPCSAEWAFVGWSETAIAPMSMLPALEITAGTSTYTPTADKTLYAIYRKTSESSPFVAGMSGAYKISNGSTVYAGACNNSKLPETNAAGAYVFYIKYTSADGGKYTIQQADGKYLKYAGSSTSLALDEATPYYWTMTKNGDLWHVLGVGSDRYLQYSSGTGFKAYNGSGYTDIAFVAADGQYYYRTMSCEDDFDIIFHENGTTINWATGYPEASYKDLANATVISTFPTATFDGWTFLGWRTADYTESTTAPASSGIFGGSNGTSGNTLTIASANVDLYPVFTRFEDNEPFDQINGGDYYIYYLSNTDDGYGAYKRVYAGEYADKKRYESTPLCSSATEFTFTKLENGKWTILDKNTGKYLYGTTGEEDKILQKDVSTEWTIEVYSGNQFTATCSTNTYGKLKAYGDGTSARFMLYANSNDAEPGYHRVYLGSCTNRTFTTNPSTTPNIELHGQVKVTSTADKSIKAASVLTVSASNIATANLTVTSDNSAFKFCLTSNGSYTASVNIPVVSNKVGVTPIYVEYTPTATTDGIEDATITVSDGASPTPTTATTNTGDVQGRHVPANFVIAAKWGDKWYALPANCTESTSSTTGVLIEVDNASDPTTATYAPSYTKWGLQTVRPSRKAEYGTRLVFTEQVTTATTEDQKTLYNGSTTNIQANAMYKNYMGDATDKYEWIPTTMDLKDYILTSATTLGDDASARTVSLSNKGVFGTLLTNKAYDGKVRLLPATFVEPAEIQVIEWKASSVVVMYTGSGTKAITQLGDDAPSSAQSLSSAKIDHGVFELTTGALTSAKNEPLNITIQNGSDAIVGRKSLVVPAIVSGSQNAPLGLETDETKLTDVVILDGATLSAVTTKYTFKNITVYPGGKLVIGSGKQLGMASLTLRGGSSWGAATYEHKYPQFVVNNTADGAYSNSAAVINYDYVTTKAQYYTFVLPYNGSTSTIKYPVDIYGSAVSASNTGSFEFQYYDGAARAGGGTGWAVLAEPATLVAGTGYTFLGMPKKVDAYDGTDNSHASSRQTYGIHRIPMSVAAGTVQSGENNNKTAPLSVTLADKNNNSGWNLVGNPFMSTLTGMSSTDIQVGNLIHSDTDPWDGKWRWNPESSQRFVVIPDDNGQDYKSYQATTAVLPAFKNFFVQISNSSATTISFAASGRNDKNLIRALLTNEQEKDIELAVDLVSATKSDKVDLLINDTYSAEFDQDADFTKMMNGSKLNIYGVYPDDKLSFIAVDKTTASNSIAIGYQVPEAGEYILRLSDLDYVMADAIEALYVTDHEMSPEITTNLLEDEYPFHVNQAEINDTRFTVSIKIKSGTNTATDIDDIRDVSDQPKKFLYRDKMYILRGGKIYDATGKQVREINK